MVKIKGTAKLFKEDQDIELSIFAPFADYLSPEVRSITVDDDGLLIGVSTDSGEDNSPYVAYPPLAICDTLSYCRKIQKSELQELDRLGPFVDLVSYKDEGGTPHKVVFKFNVMDKPLRLQMAWDEINILSLLPPHPNILPFDRIVVEGEESRVLGFTTRYIPGQTLDNPKIPFRFEWLQQLTQVVDFLNLELGIMHQDIAPRNLLIDAETEKILLFDFDRAASGKKNLSNGPDDVTAVAFTLYKLITNHESFSHIPHWDRTIHRVQNISEWPSHRPLDAKVAKFRNFLNEWIETRSDGDMKRYLNAPRRFTWPDRPEASEYSVPFQLGTFTDGKPYMTTGPRSRRTAMKLGSIAFAGNDPHRAGC
ncbi:uncharacterized protein N7483_011291 [Penicillium malachiteum]|uniref:uncharacterized protein n=1 Tax=Penicillium malachiteum TaxID=1324776 RepID=UPI0025480232|nr:uncharacterized protein N7483_011291 [Penicillium malachiteum]KAJ5714110.1 hypothetical protein N7483_011291 [Penicillium malachiteum]